MTNRAAGRIGQLIPRFAIELSAQHVNKLLPIRFHKIAVHVDLAQLAIRPDAGLVPLATMETRSMPYNLFISHSWAYTDAYDKLVRMLNAAPRFEWRDYSVPRNDPIHNAPNAVKLREAIKTQMIFTNVVVVMAGVYATYSKWINEEIDLAHRGFSVRKPVLAIEPYGSERTSKFVKDNADLIVKWNTSSIIAGVRALA